MGDAEEDKKPSTAPKGESGESLNIRIRDQTGEETRAGGAATRRARAVPDAARRA